MKREAASPIVDTHRHPVGLKLSRLMAERGLFDASKPFPQAGAGDVIFYREFVDLAYAMPKQRQAGVTLSLMSNGGEVDWIGREILRYDLPDTLKFFRDEYLHIREVYPGEFASMANAVAIDEASRLVVEEMLDKHGAKAIAVSSSYGDGSGRQFLDSPKAEWLWELAEDKDVVVHIHPPMNATSHEMLGLYRLNEAIGRPYDSTVNLARMIGSGLFDRHPKLQVMVVHVGGDITSIIGRLKFCWELNYKDVPNPPADRVIRNKRPPHEYLRTNVLADTMGFNPTAVRAAIELFGVDRIVLGTDYGPVPYGVEEHIDMIGSVLSDANDREKVLWRNSDRIFRLGLAASGVR